MSGEAELYLETASGAAIHGLLPSWQRLMVDADKADWGHSPQFIIADIEHIVTGWTMAILSCTCWNLQMTNKSSAKIGRGGLCSQSFSTTDG